MKNRTIASITCIFIIAILGSGCASSVLIKDSSLEKRTFSLTILPDLMGGVLKVESATDNLQIGEIDSKSEDIK